MSTDPRWTTPPLLEGNYVRLEPLLPAHADGLRSATEDRRLLRHRDGSLGDTANYSIIDGEWPTVKAALLRDLGDRRHE